MLDLDLLSNTRIALGTHRFLPQFDRLQRVYTEQVGFLRRSDLDYLISLQTCRVLLAGGQLIGTMVWSGGLRRPPCLRQLCISEDLWHRGCGEAATRYFVRESPTLRFRHPRVRTRVDLLYQSIINRRLGGEITAASPPGKRKFAVAEWTFDRSDITGEQRSPFESPRLIEYTSGPLIC